MIDKIIEELVRLKIENAPMYYDDDYEQGYKQAMNDVEQIVKKYENDGWILCNDRLPESNYDILNHKDYLTYNEYGTYMILPYCEGWNCTPNLNGTPCKENEITDVVAYRELPQPYKGE